MKLKLIKCKNLTYVIVLPNLISTSYANLVQKMTWDERHFYILCLSIFYLQYIHTYI